jgi:hypothetical protein
LRGRTKNGRHEDRVGEVKGRGSFIAKTLLKRHLDNFRLFKVSDFVRRISLPLQTLPYRNSRPIAATNPCSMYDTALGGN